MTSFNPVKRVGAQLSEVAAEHHGLTKKQAAARAVDRLRAVRIAHPERRARQFPHELSGGMRQRAMIGMAVMGEPALVIADEPTTALDVTVQRQVLRLLSRSRRRSGSRWAAVHQPRHHRRGAGLRPGARHVRGADRGEPARRRTWPNTPGTRTRGRCSPRCPPWRRPRAAAGGDPRAARRPGGPAPAGCAFAARRPFADAGPAGQSTRRWSRTRPGARSPAGTRRPRERARGGGSWPRMVASSLVGQRKRFCC